jgi:hypothetical protein
MSMSDMWRKCLSTKDGYLSVGLGNVDSFLHKNEKGFYIEG